jgi:hypothetical protein
VAHIAAAVAVPRADLPPVAVRRIDPAALPPLSTKEDGYVPGHPEQILLDLATGDLAYHLADWRLLIDTRIGSERWNELNPGESTPPWRPGYIDYMKSAVSEPADLLRNWGIDSWATERDDPHAVSPRPYMTPEEAQTFVDSLAPIAQRLVEGMVRVEGTRDLDWSAAAIAAARDISRACARDELPPAEEYPNLVDFADVVAALPDVVDPAWVYATDADLDRAANELGRPHRFKRSQDSITLYRSDEDKDADDLEVWGVRAWLYAYRAQAAEHLQITDATQWYTTRPAPVTASMTDEGLAALAEHEQVAAAAEGAKLVGLGAALRAAREVARDRVWAELGAVGADTATAEKTFKQLRAARAGLLTQVLGWGDERSRVDADLARHARVTRQAIGQLRDRLAADDLN